ncbi:hypothetical protein LWC34_53165 [Kibdelosporangium philippinense]|uniref:Uncharacterized protein n=1 Tax=Kibdelosporangium philippinense TaxID=211113 RepID=A0ABS8ZUU9_9PSEU|nr:hypothetical protein [Kibdelosporangium philippinense]MCE7011510.1 hypothetical protein [Kibdelosporangium philippinense]
MATGTQQPDKPPGEVVSSLRSQASWFTVLADTLTGADEASAAVAREEAVRLRCHAAVVEQLSELYDELGSQAQMWSTFAKGLWERK